MSIAPSSTSQASVCEYQNSASCRSVRLVRDGVCGRRKYKAKTRATYSCADSSLFGIRLVAPRTRSRVGTSRQSAQGRTRTSNQTVDKNERFGDGGLSDWWHKFGGRTRLGCAFIIWRAYLRGVRRGAGANGRARTDPTIGDGRRQRSCRDPECVSGAAGSEVRATFSNHPAPVNFSHGSKWIFQRIKMDFSYP
jgi:hypothetical protein